MLAYVCRYGHQPINVAKSLTVRELRQLADKIADIIEQENQSGNRS
jgi:hypothetical protein